MAVIGRTQVHTDFIIQEKKERERKQRITSGSNHLRFVEAKNWIVRNQCRNLATLFITLEKLIVTCKLVIN